MRNQNRQVVSLQRQKSNSEQKKHPIQSETTPKESVSTRLNKFIANAGICSRRRADELIENGQITVDGRIITELGFKVGFSSKVYFQGRELFPEKNKVYIVLNKPKNCITTSEDPEGRKIASDYLDNEIKERVYPVGRLDRNTTGILLFTNDGELAQKLTHPSKEVKKVYLAELNKDFKNEDRLKLTAGIHLEDGEIHADNAAFPDVFDKKKVGIEIHSGRNRIVRRMFEHLGYEVKKLDRVLFADLDKRKLKRGESRRLTEREVRQLKLLVNLK
jgi:23S rRNA pseudouridine2605 synthase